MGPKEIPLFVLSAAAFALGILTLGVAEVGAQETSVRDGVAVLPEGF